MQNTTERAAKKWIDLCNEVSYTFKQKLEWNDIDEIIQVLNILAKAGKDLKMIFPNNSSFYLESDFQRAIEDDNIFIKTALRWYQTKPISLKFEKSNRSPIFYRFVLKTVEQMPITDNKVIDGYETLFFDENSGYVLEQDLNNSNIVCRFICGGYFLFMSAINPENNE